jgi:hypothetical protein
MKVLIKGLKSIKGSDGIRMNIDLHGGTLVVEDPHITRLGILLLLLVLQEAGIVNKTKNNSF